MPGTQCSQSPSEGEPLTLDNVGQASAKLQEYLAQQRRLAEYEESMKVYTTYSEALQHVIGFSSSRAEGTTNTTNLNNAYRSYLDSRDADTKREAREALETLCTALTGKATD